MMDGNEREKTLKAETRKYKDYGYPVIATVNLPSSEIWTRLYKREGYAFRWARKVMEAHPGSIGLIRTTNDDVWDFGDGEWVGAGY